MSVAADPIASAVTLLPSGRTVRVSPEALSRKVLTLDAAADVPRYGLFEWQATGDGDYRPVIRIHSRLIRLPRAARLFDIDVASLRRLVTAGFVTGTQPTPGTVQIDVHSYCAHIAAVQSDPEFWTPARRAQYAAAL